MPDGLTNRAQPSSTSHLQNSRHVELVRAYRLEQSGWRFESSGPPRTPALHEICPPNTREFAQAHRPTFESLRGKVVWGVSRSAGNARPETRFCKPTRDRPHSALMFAARITLPHFSVSSAINLTKSAGEPGSTVPPKSANRAFILGSARAALISALSLLTISAGVFLGAPMPYQPLAS